MIAMHLLLCPKMVGANRDGVYGWLLRSTHANSASGVFLFMYLHVMRAWSYGVVVVVQQYVWMIGDPIHSVHAFIPPTVPTILME